jgi:hypothetical protein
MKEIKVGDYVKRVVDLDTFGSFLIQNSEYNKEYVLRNRFKVLDTDGINLKIGDKTKDGYNKFTRWNQCNFQRVSSLLDWDGEEC